MDFHFVKMGRIFSAEKEGRKRLKMLRILRESAQRDFHGVKMGERVMFKGFGLLVSG